MKNKIIFLDTETTGIKNPGLIQLGYIVCDLTFKEIKRENLFFKTDKKIEFGAMAIHHITEEILSEKLKEDGRENHKKIELAINDFKNAYLIAHNSPFDRNVLETNNIPTAESSRWIDTYNISYGLFTDEDMKHSLQFLRYYLGCTFSEIIDPHDALSDVIVLKAVFIKIFGRLEEEAFKNGAEPEKEELLEIMAADTDRGIILRNWAFGKYKGRSFSETFKMDKGYFTWMYNTKIEDGNTDDAVFNTLKYYLKK